VNAAWRPTRALGHFSINSGEGQAFFYKPPSGEGQAFLYKPPGVETEATTFLQTSTRPWFVLLVKIQTCRWLIRQ